MRKYCNELRNDITRITLSDGNIISIGKGITKIKEVQRCGEHSFINYYEVYVNEKHVADIHNFSMVEYI